MKTLYSWLLSVFSLVTATAQQSTETNTTQLNSIKGRVTLANFEAIPNGKFIQISWNAMGEANMSNYEIQKSTNGSAFTSISTISAQNNQTNYKYNYIDAAPVNGINYYRIYSLDKAGRGNYSNILAVNTGFRQSKLVVLPNPVQGGVLNLQLSNFESGKYNISLFSNAGQRVFARSMNFSEGSSNEIINIPTSISRGMYFLQVSDGSYNINKQVMLQ